MSGGYSEHRFLPVWCHARFHVGLGVSLLFMFFWERTGELPCPVPTSPARSRPRLRKVVDKIQTEGDRSRVTIHPWRRVAWRVVPEGDGWSYELKQEFK